MLSKLSVVLLFVVGLINFLPLIGVLSGAKIAQTYAVELASNDLIILMRHRALLFGLVGGFVLYSIFEPQFQTAALTMAGISMLGFLVIMYSVGGYNASINKVAMVDIVGIVCLILVIILKVVKSVKEPAL
jgi:hypothetical protein